MYCKPYNATKNLVKHKLPLVTGSNKSSPNSLFSVETFGTTEDNIFSNAGLIPLNAHIMYGWALDQFKRLDRVIYECATSTRGRFLYSLKTRTIQKVEPDYENDPTTGILGYGPEFLYSIWDKMDKTKYKKTEGKLANVQMSSSVLKYSRDQLFTTHQYVIPIGYREEEQDSAMIFNETNKMLSSIAKYSSLIADNSNVIKTDDIKVYLQNAVLELYQLNTSLYGSHGKLRRNMLSRVVDQSSRGVLLTGIYSRDTIGESRFECDSLGIPIFHLNKMFSHTVKKNFKTLLNMLFDYGLFDDDTTVDMLAVYDVAFIDEAIKNFDDNYTKVQPFPAIKKDGTFGELTVNFTTNGEVTTKALTWIEFFYIILYALADIENRRYVAGTRYPVDSDKSCQVLRPIILTISDKLLKTVSVMSFLDMEYFPLITEEIANMYTEKIFEAGMRASSTVVEGWNGEMVAHTHGNMCLKS